MDTQSLRSFVALVAVAAATLASCTPTSEAPEGSQCQRCNIIQISIDTLRADHLSLYGYDRPTSPNLDEFAKEAVVFDRFFYNGGGTLPSHISMFTSLHPATHNVGPHNERVLEAERVTQAEVLRAAGYDTAAFTDAGWMRGRFGLEQGFDLYDDRGGRLEAILPRVRTWLDEPPNQPFFLFLHTYDVHSEWDQLPYDCPGDYPLRYAQGLETEFDGCWEGRCASQLLAWINERTKQGLAIPTVFDERGVNFLRALYDGCINYVDDQLAEFFAELRHRDLFEESLIVVTSDHGEEFMEHGRFLHDGGGYEEYAHIPLIIKLPGGDKGGTRIPQLAAMVDLMPTVLDLVGLNAPEDAQGRSLMNLVEGAQNSRRDLHMYQVLRTDRHKYFPNAKWLFDLQGDPQEQHNIYPEHPELAGELQRRIDQLIADDQAAREEFAKSVAGEVSERQLTAEEIEELRALGYLQ